MIVLAVGVWPAGGMTGRQHAAECGLLLPAPRLLVRPTWRDSPANSVHTEQRMNLVEYMLAYIGHDHPNHEAMQQLVEPPPYVRKLRRQTERFYISKETRKRG